MQGQRPRASAAGARTRGLRRPGQLPGRRSTDARVLARVAAGADLRRDPGADDARPGAAVRAAAGRAPGPAARRFARIAIFLPYAVPGVIATLLWGFLYLPSVSPVPVPARASSACRRSTCSARRRSTSRVANIALWGGVGFNMIVHLHRAAGDPDASSTSRPASTAPPSCRSPADQDPAGDPGADHDRGLLAHRHAAGVQRADHAAAADQLALRRPGRR